MAGALLFALACGREPQRAGTVPPVAGSGGLGTAGEPVNVPEAGASGVGAPGGAMAIVPPLDAGTAGAAGAEPEADAGPLPHATRVSLVDHFLWQQLGPEDDPFDDRPAVVDCAADGINPELLAGELSYGVDTGPCSYLTVRQPARLHANAGETIVVRLWHFALNAPDAGEGHAVVEIDGLRVMDERVPIPAPGGLIKVEAKVERAVAAGAPVLFHLHNHGENSWALVEVSIGP